MLAVRSGVCTYREANFGAVAPTAAAISKPEDPHAARWRGCLVGAHAMRRHGQRGLMGMVSVHECESVAARGVANRRSRLASLW
jgi:hypothetical protein